MRRLAFPILGHLLVSEVDTPHIKAVLSHDKLWTTRTPTATKLRGNLEQVLAYATTEGLRSGENPARWRGRLDGVLASPKKVHRGKNQPALPVEQLPAFMAELRSAAGDAARALEVAILCASRSQEVRGMTWAEVDLDAARWTIPGLRMKMRRPHAVPLSARVVELLRAQAEKKPDDVDLVFPAGESNTELSDMTLLAVIKRMNQRRKAAGEPLWVDPAQGGRPVVPHGFRATFRVWARAQRFADDAAEAALAHAEENETIAAYKRTDHFEERAPMMKAWADYCAGKA
jgi:integrase